ncbi:helix-turn-helix domain-containing protein [Nitrospina gracilis]|uniref:helix-turn-helix domain-containing protein n=1 Tax=Nitrospina gracilis TaxID=35801 RepID=UPI001F40CB4A|nr:helix-turn-helix transcriptional regulator [Nitrospina gracilis]MCF8719456.1 DNA-binding NarL/FixJ family response regulator [Nitrospina gracilis Nb-211]
MNDTVTSSLAEEDYLKVFDIINSLTRCKSMHDLKQVLEIQLFPLIKVEMGGFVWSGRDFLSGGNPVQGLICSVGIEDQERDQACLLEVGPYHKQFMSLVTTTHRNVLAGDVDYPRETYKKEIREFLKDHPRFEGTRYAQSHVTIALLDRPEFNVGLGLCRIHPNEDPFTLREVRILELLHPGLISTAKTIALNTELKTWHALIEGLTNNRDPFVLVRKDGRVLFRNTAFRAIAPVEAGSLLPKMLRELVEQKIALDVPDQPPESSISPMTFYQYGDTVYRLNVTQLTPEEGNAEQVWLLRLQTADDPHTQLHHKLQTAELTPREVEVTILMGDGLDDADIAQRLFISPHTLKNHLKNIYRKLDVHSRTQLVARLRPPASSQEG